MKVVVMRGVSGSGKSTWIKNNYPGAYVCSADHFFEKDGEYIFDASKLSAAHNECLRQFIYAMESNYDVVVVDNTNTTVVEMAPYVRVAEALGKDVEIVRLECSYKVASKRNQHGVPAKTIQMMENRMHKRLPAHWPSETVVDSHGSGK